MTINVLYLMMLIWSQMIETYTYPESNQPRHMSVVIDKFGYKLLYKQIFGSVCAFTRRQLQIVNGFSNEFWGWGAEDDHLYNRVRYHGYNIARYKKFKHKPDTRDPNYKEKLISGSKRFKFDELNSFEYKRVALKFIKNSLHGF